MCYSPFGMALFGSATPVSRIVGQAFPPFLASGMRMATAAAVLLPAVAVLARRRSQGDEAHPPVRWVPTLTRRDWLLLLAIAGIGTVWFTIFLLYALRTLPGAVGAIVMATTPAVTAVGSVVFLSDTLDRWTTLGIAGVRRIVDTGLRRRPPRRGMGRRAALAAAGAPRVGPDRALADGPLATRAV